MVVPGAHRPRGGGAAGPIRPWYRVTYRCTDVQMNRCTDEQMYRCTDVQSLIANSTLQQIVS